MKNLLLLLLLISCGFKYSEGSRTGLLYKLSRKGFICKSWEGILKTGFTTTLRNGYMVSEEFKFSVETDDMAESMRQLEGKQVVIDYVQKKLNGPCSPDSEYRIISIREIK